MEVTNSTGPIVNFQGERKIPTKEHKINLSGKTDNSTIIYNETATDIYIYIYIYIYIM